MSFIRHFLRTMFFLKNKIKGLFYAAFIIQAPSSLETVSREFFFSQMSKSGASEFIFCCFWRPAAERPSCTAD